MTIKEANSYIHYCIKEGFCEPEMFEGMSEPEIIQWAKYNGERGDYEANNNEREPERL